MSYKLCFHTFYELRELLLLLYLSWNTVTIAQLSNLCGYVRRYVVGVVTWSYMLLKYSYILVKVTRLSSVELELQQVLALKTFIVNKKYL